ncbi:ROK family protein (plasmid) [Qingshengfaniella alkalisoli]|uniref:ROK family protein n=1 Tax=Qingshengfaniella alkalisoli TaxID=2599296 RepID=A0A5B8J2M2_9RHOB|nr:ROK family protein [Qingshengfaniella alkalisoli]
MCCFDIGGSYIRYGVPCADGDVVEQGRVSTPTASWKALVAALRNACDETDAQIASLSLAGAFPPDGGSADVANIPCLNGRDVQGDLARAMGCKVLVTNDADCFALAEAHLGAAKNQPIVFGAIIGSGVGGGVVINGELLRGFGGISGEWGHGPVLDATLGGLLPDTEPLACGCGQNGCIDAVCSARGMEKLHLQLNNDALTSLEITRRWKAGDAQATRTIDVYTRYLAQSLSVIVNTLGPHIIPVGGGLSSEPTLIEMIDRQLREMVLADFASPVVVPGHLSANGGLVGAGIVAAQHLHHKESAT